LKHWIFIYLKRVPIIYPNILIFKIFKNKIEKASLRPLILLRGPSQAHQKPSLGVVLAEAVREPTNTGALVAQIKTSKYLNLT